MDTKYSQQFPYLAINKFALVLDNCSNSTKKQTKDHADISFYVFHLIIWTFLWTQTSVERNKNKKIRADIKFKFKL